MALIQSALIWVVYAVVLVILLAIASVFVYIYQAPRERAASVTIVCIFTLLSLLATLFLLPVDVALVSSTTSSKTGRRKDWATQDEVDSILKTLKILYYTLYSLDALLCLIVLPFTYFWYEAYDEVAAEEGSQTLGKRFWEAFKYTIAFILLTLILFLVGFFVPNAKDRKGAHYDLDYFQHLLTEQHGERALTFALGLLITMGTLIYVIYTAAGFALLPVALIKSAPGISAPTLSANTASELEQNRERQHQLESRSSGSENGLPAKDRRELDALIREERTLVRRERLAAEASGEGQTWLVKAWTKTEAIFRPIKLLGGIFLMLIAIFIWVCMLLTFIDKAKNSICKSHCGYVLGYTNILNPMNWIFVKSAKVFPIDYVIFLLLVLFFFSSSVVGIASIGIRFLWLKIFQIRKGHTSPQALLLATMMLALIVLAINYSMAMIVAPGYTHYGPQTYCDRPLRHPTDQPDCSNHRRAIKPCSELSTSQAAMNVCTPSVVSTFLDRVTVNWSFFGDVDFWAQIAFLAVYLLIFVLSLFRTPKLDEYQMDQDAEEDEEEGLLASTGRRFGATWQDITGTAKKTKGNAGRENRNNDPDEAPWPAVTDVQNVQTSQRKKLPPAPTTKFAARDVRRSTRAVSSQLEHKFGPPGKLDSPKKQDKRKRVHSPKGDVEEKRKRTETTTTASAPESTATVTAFRKLPELPDTPEPVDLRDLKIQKLEDHVHMLEAKSKFYDEQAAPLLHDAMLCVYKAVNTLNTAKDDAALDKSVETLTKEYSGLKKRYKSFQEEGK